MLIIDTSDSKPDPAQSLRRVAELELKRCVKPLLQSKIRFRKAGRMLREGIEHMFTSEVRKFCAGTQKMMGQVLAYQATNGWCAPFVKHICSTNRMVIHVLYRDLVMKSKKRHKPPQLFWRWRSLRGGWHQEAEHSLRRAKRSPTTQR